MATPTFFLIDTNPQGDTGGAEQFWLLVIAENEAQAKTKAWNLRLLQVIYDFNGDEVEPVMDKLGDDKQLADIGGMAEIAEWLGMGESDLVEALDNRGYDSIQRAEEVKLEVLGSGKLNTKGINEAFQEFLDNAALASGR